MKKIFLLFGIAAFSAASAQQKDVFDIHKHLQKKNELNIELTIDDLFVRRGHACFGGSSSLNIPFSEYRLRIMTARNKAKILTALTSNNKTVYSIPPIRYINTTYF